MTEFDKKVIKKILIIEVITILSAILTMIAGLFSFIFVINLKLPIFYGFLLFLYLLLCMTLLTIGANKLRAGRRFYQKHNLKSGAKFLITGGFLSCLIPVAILGLWIFRITKKIDFEQN